MFWCGDGVVPLCNATVCIPGPTLLACLLAFQISSLKLPLNFILPGHEVGKRTMVLNLSKMSVE